VFSNIGSGDAEISISDLDGKVLWTSNAIISNPAQTIKVERNELAPGVYVITIRTAENKLALKFVKN
jgi:hypothetical protein